MTSRGIIKRVDTHRKTGENAGHGAKYAQKGSVFSGEIFLKDAAVEQEHHKSMLFPRLPFAKMSELIASFKKRGISQIL